VSITRDSGYAKLLSDLVVPVANGLIQNIVTDYCNTNLYVSTTVFITQGKM